MNLGQLLKFMGSMMSQLGNMETQMFGSILLMFLIIYH